MFTLNKDHFTTKHIYMSFITKPKMDFHKRENRDQMIILKVHTQECKKSFQVTGKGGRERSFSDKVLIVLLSTNQTVQIVSLIRKISIRSKATYL